MSRSPTTHNIFLFWEIKLIKVSVETFSISQFSSDHRELCLHWSQCCDVSGWRLWAGSPWMTGDTSRCQPSHVTPGGTRGAPDSACAVEGGAGGSGCPGRGRDPHHTSIFLYSFLHSSVHPYKVRSKKWILTIVDRRANFQWQGLGQRIRVSETNTSCSETVKIPLNVRITLLVTRNANSWISAVYNFPPRLKY